MTYEYVCTACQHAWEAEQPISAAPLKTCPSCQAETAKRQISGGAGFILKGGGWYADLYSSSKSTKSEASGSETKKTESTTTSTPAASKETSSTSKETSSTSTPSASSSAS